ncbi:MAG: hypothetical protein GF331_19730 [Chitinivibrionales bacterium]|nr:hypothetical protein [Chitinivibrionales bacterium]
MAPRISSLLVSTGVLLGCCVLLHCADDNPVTADETVDEMTVDLAGVVEKGPFIAGTTILLSELDNRLRQTGRVYVTNTVNDVGAFEVQQARLRSGYVEVLAQGYFFDEYRGLVSASPLSLSLLTSVEQRRVINVNLLSHIESARLRLLVEDGERFEDAKKQAHTELLAAFGILDRAVAEAEALTVADSGRDNAVLLAISVVLMGSSPVGELSEFLAHLRADFADNGQIDSLSLRERLAANARDIDPAGIEENLRQRYVSLGAAARIPDFAGYIDTDGDGILNRDEDDDTPDPFAIPDHDWVWPDSVVRCSVTVTGLSATGHTLAQVSQGQLAVGGELPGESWAPVSNGDTLVVVVTAPADFGAKDTLVVRIGSVSDSFTIATRSKPIVYPDSCDYGLSLLNTVDTAFKANTGYSFSAILPQAPGAALRVVMRRTEGYASFYDAGWMLAMGMTNGWNHNGYDTLTHSQEFYVVKAYGTADMWIELAGYGTAVIEIYEYDSQTPTRTKTITWDSQ